MTIASDSAVRVPGGPSKQDAPVLSPKVSVMMIAMNGDPWIDECIQSVLAQTMQDFEFIIIDDGSSDGTWEKIKSYDDPRIRAFTQKNIGIAASANRGLGLARAPYMARIDQDDVMLPTRLEKQFSFLEAHPDVVLVCTYAQLIYDFDLSDDYYRAPISSTALRLRLVFENPVVQPSVLVRTAEVKALGGYDESPEFFSSSDFELWTKLAQNHGFGTIPEALTRYRVRRNSVSHDLKSIDHNVLISAKFLYALLKHHCSKTECLSLAQIFHRKAGPVAPLGLRRALGMFDSVAHLIAGPRDKWDAETKAIYAMQRRMIFFHHILRRQLFVPLIQKLPALRLR